MLIDNRDEVHSNLVILCQPNGAPYQLFAKVQTMINLYHDLGVSVLLWNYRGYGDSTGSPNYSSIEKDVLLIKEIVERKGPWNKIAVHGRSMGGFAASCLIKTGIIDLAVFDRNFSSIDNIVENYTMGFVLGKLYRALWYGSSDTVENVVFSECSKILFCDPNDEIIIDQASL